ncbi:MAG TPA: hypothetical protein VGM50_06100, partial [Gemmatimonadaceae bacterium]
MAFVDVNMASRLARDNGRGVNAPCERNQFVRNAAFGSARVARNAGPALAMTLTRQTTAAT